MYSKRHRHTLFPQLKLDVLLFELLNTKVINTERAVSLYMLFDHLVCESNDEQLVEIMSFLPACDGAALPFSAGLFHARPEVRNAAARIIQRLFLQKVTCP